MVVYGFGPGRLGSISSRLWYSSGRRIKLILSGHVGILNSCPFFAFQAYLASHICFMSSPEHSSDGCVWIWPEETWEYFVSMVLQQGAAYKTNTVWPFMPIFCFSSLTSVSYSLYVLSRAFQWWLCMDLARGDLGVFRLDGATASRGRHKTNTVWPFMPIFCYSSLTRPR